MGMVGVTSDQYGDGEGGIVIENPIGMIEGHVSATETFVKTEISTNRTASDTALATAYQTIANLGLVKLTLPGDVIPLPNVEFDVNLDLTIDPLVPSDFGVIDEWIVGPAPGIGDLPSIDDVNIVPFEPSIGGPIIPPTPRQRLISTPDAPPYNPGFSFPLAPVLEYPPEPILIGITIPIFQGITIPEFDATFPTLEDPIINTLINWIEPTYTEEIIADVIAKMRQMLAGGLAIDPAIEQGIVDRGRDREDRLTRQAISQALNEFASRGYTEPPGLLIDRIDQIREESTLKKLGLNREVVLKIFDEELANMRLAVQQGIVAEELYMRLFLAGTERLFEVKKIDLESQIALYNIMVTAFNARMRQVEIQASVYETQLRAEVTKIDAYKALIQAEMAKAETNKVMVEAYVAQISAREAFVNIYEAQVRAVGLQVQAYATEIEAYKGTVEAYAAEIGAEKLKFDAYEAQIRGELGKASIIESEARAYMAEIEGIRAGVSAQVERVRGETNKIEAAISAYAAEVQGTTAKAGLQLSQIQANVAGYTADTQRFIASLSAEETADKLKITAWEAQNTVDIAYFEAQMSKFKVDLEALIQQARLGLDALKATGDISSTISAGALAAMHLGASINSGTSMSANGSQGVSFGESFSRSYGKACQTSHSVSYNDPVTDVNVSCPF